MNLESIQKESFEQPLYLFFTTRYCGTCRGFQCSIDALVKQLHYPIITIDTEIMRDISKAFDVSGVPVLMRVEKGLEIARRSGSTTSEELLEWLRQHHFEVA